MYSKNKVLSFTCLIIILLLLTILSSCKLSITSISGPGSVFLNDAFFVTVDGYGTDQGDDADSYGIVLQIPENWQVLGANATIQPSELEKYILQEDHWLQTLFRPEPGYKVWAGSASESRTGSHSVKVRIKIVPRGTVGTFWIKAIAAAHRFKWVADDPARTYSFQNINDSSHRMTITVKRFPLPDSGAEKCYDNNWKIPCPTRYNTFFGQDAQQYGPKPSFQDNQDGTLTDLVTGMVWQRDTVDVNEDGTVDELDKLTWQEASEFCDALELAGYDDWHLPTFFELMTIINFNYSQPAAFFQFATVRSLYATYWSSTHDAADQDKHWGINFFIGKPFAGNSASTSYCRCVRGHGPYEPGHYRVPVTGVVQDLSTGLMWQKSAVDINGDGSLDENDRVNWARALDYCSDLDYAGFQDWRLPSIRESLSLMDPSSDPRFSFLFERSPFVLNLEWTSTSRALPNAYLAWSVFMGDHSGNAYSTTWKDDNNAAIRCVRGGLMPPGDFDRDGDVDGVDLARLKAAYNQEDHDKICDINFDGDVDFLDMDKFLDTFGTVME